MNLKALKDRINKLVDEIEAAVNAGEYERAVELKTEHTKAMSQYEALKDLELKRMSDPDGGVPAPKPLDDESKKFFNALRQSFKNLMKSETDENGGYTVPQDIQTKINKYKEEHATLINLVNVEKVETEKGSRIYQKKGKRKGFSKVEENGVLVAVDEPAYEQVEYEIEDFGGYLPITNKLLNDSDAALEKVIIDWLGEKGVATDNEQILETIMEGTPKQVSTIDDILLHAVKTVGRAYDVAIVTNSSGLLYIYGLKDQNGRSLVQPNPAEPSKPVLHLGPIAYHISFYDDNDMPNIGYEENEDGSVKTAGDPPVFIGDLKAAVTLYDRQQTKIFASEHASVTDAEGKVLYNAFSQRGKIFRADVRNDVKMIDKGAYVYGMLKAKES